jgi:hypothetical protein
MHNYVGLDKVETYLVFSILYFSNITPATYSFFRNSCSNSAAGIGLLI